jgi:hypothetical protein
MALERRTVHLPIPPWFRDHRFNDRVLLPAVEAMRLLAATAQAAHPELDVRRMEQGRFAKFLALPPEASGIDVLVELETGAGGKVDARLLTRTQLKTMARMTNHCQLVFTAGSAQVCRELTMTPPSPSDPAVKVSAEQVYWELVPFGPAYRTLHGQLIITQEWARGTLQAPDLPIPSEDPVGSPFPLDGAMHAACVHGQRLVDFVPFPVGFDIRIIHQPTLPGEQYAAHVRLQSHAVDELVYDLQIRDLEEQLRETVVGLRMRDVSGGRIKPPAWIQRDSGQKNGLAA